MSEQINLAFGLVKMALDREYSDESGHKFTVVSAELVPLHQRIKKTGQIEPAPGVIFACEREGKPTRPLQVAVYSGGSSIDIVRDNGDLHRIASYGYDAVRGSNKASYEKPGTPEIADFIFGLTAEILDTEEGRKFRASLKSAEAKEAAKARRNVREGFSSLLAVQGDHYATARKTTSPEAYYMRSEERRINRENGLPPGGLVGAISVEDGLPF